MLVKLMLLAVGGASGTLARVGVFAAVNSLHGGPFPLGTLAVNGVGSLLFGVLWAIIDERWSFGAHATAFLLAGFMGAFTTFSTFAFETHDLASRGQYAWAVGNVVANNAVAILMAFLGVYLGRAMVSGG